MTQKIYRGERGGTVNVILSSGKAHPLRHVVLHSRSGFGWGYSGSGPADLALSLLCDVLDERPTENQIFHGWFKAFPHHQEFKREFVARWKFNGNFEIDSETIADWLRERGVKV